jgi:hypothetical protein
VWLRRFLIIGSLLAFALLPVVAENVPSRWLPSGVSWWSAWRIHEGMSAEEVEAILGTRAVPFGKAPGGACGAVKCRFQGPEGVIVVWIFATTTSRATFYPVGSPEYDEIMNERPM